MRYVTSIERLGFRRGWLVGFRQGWHEGFIEGLAEAITIMLEAKFGAAAKRLARKVRALQDVERLRAVVRAVATAESLDDVRALLE